jgi:hypothetical protein
MHHEGPCLPAATLGLGDWQIDGAEYDVPLCQRRDSEPLTNIDLIACAGGLAAPRATAAGVLRGL